MVKRVEDSAVIKIMNPPVASVAVVEPLVKSNARTSSNLHRPSSSGKEDMMISDALHSPSSHSSNSSFFSSIRLRKATNGWFKDFTRTERTLSISLLFSIGLLVFFFTIILLLLTTPKNKLSCKPCFLSSTQIKLFNCVAGPSLYGIVSTQSDEPCLTPLCVAAGMFFLSLNFH